MSTVRFGKGGGRRVSRRDLLCNFAVGSAAAALDRGTVAKAANLPEPVAEPKATPAIERPGVREYWVAARNVPWSPSPTGYDDWHSRKVRRERFMATAYIATEPDWGEPLPQGGIGDNTGIPGPVLRAHPGDEIVVHFRNEDEARKRPHTMHPHGVRYTPEHDGSYMGKYTRPGGAVRYGESHTYRWQAGEDSIGVWPYHDHGRFEADSTQLGMFGAIVITARGEAEPDAEFTIFFHRFDPDVTGLRGQPQLINGRTFAGNTPEPRAKVGQDVAWNVLTLGTDLHTFHVHGHRWKNAAGAWVDTPTFGPGDSFRARYKEDNPGRWLYHCHVDDHMHHGMLGYYDVDR